MTRCAECCKVRSIRSSTATATTSPRRCAALLHTAILTGQIKADQVAALLGMHSRTLNRRLNASGIGFQQLLEETRFEIARQMLEYSAAEIGQISETLGYAAPGVFTRAFRRWSGTTPAEWRAARGRRTRFAWHACCRIAIASGTFQQRAQKSTFSTRSNNCSTENVVSSSGAIGNSVITVRSSTFLMANGAI